MSSTTKRPREDGQILVLFAGGLVALLLIAALAFDVGMILVERRDQQNAADAAALAGARYVLASVPDAKDAARRLAKENGFDDADANQVVNVYVPAIHGRYKGLPGFIEVQIESTRPSIFGNVIGRANWPIGAFAVATNDQNLTFPFSMLALDPSECKAIAVSGGGVIEAYANLQSNSNGADCTSGPPVGFSRTGGATIEVHAPDATCRVVGAFQDQGSGPPITCAKSEYSFALPDPLRNLPAPPKPALAPEMKFADPSVLPAPRPPKNCPGGNPAPSEGSPSLCKIPQGGGPSDEGWILYPGLYPGGLAVSAGRTAYLMPGIYWIGGGGLDIGGGASIVSIATESDARAHVADAPCAAGSLVTPESLCGGVLIFNSKLPSSAAGAIVLNSNGAALNLASLDVPTTDPNRIYQNMVIYQDRTVTQPVTLNGSSSFTIVEGIVYAPAAQIKLNGNGGTLIVDQVIANTYDIRGDGGTIKVMRGKGVDAVITAAGLVD